MDAQGRDVKTGACGKAATDGQTAKRLDVHALLGGARELVLVHQGEEYRLRITKNDRLILTK